MHKFIVPVALGVALMARGHEAAPAGTGVMPPAAVSSVESVKAELEAMFATDQSLRQEMVKLEKERGRNSPEAQEAMKKQREIDEKNIARLEEIIAQHGWPGITKFGGKAASAAFLILQHSDLPYQQKYLPLAREAAAKGELKGSSLALLEDRVRLREGKKQLYGSQVKRNAMDEWGPEPLEDEENVDALRASVGLMPLADYLQSFAETRGGKVSPKWAKRPEK